MTFQESISWLYSQLPMFQRDGASAYKKDLTNTLKLCDWLDNPHKKLKVIHIAGTNGKGSVSHMLAAVLQAAGYKTGLYTSPHLRCFTERIRINGVPVTEEEVCRFTEKFIHDAPDVAPSFFELTVAMAFDYFVREQVEVAVIETGMGGRLDSTNVVLPMCSVITTIGLDHTAFLGPDLPSIAAEKAGIIKPGIPVVIGQRHPETAPVFEQVAARQHAPLLWADRVGLQMAQDWDYLNGRRNYVWEDEGLSISLPLAGIYQSGNLQTVLATLPILRENGFTLPAEACVEGLSDCVTKTGFQGRWQLLSQQPYALADTAHNPQGFELVMQQLAAMGAQRYHLVLGFVADKDVQALLERIPRFSCHVYACAPAMPRALEVKQLEPLLIDNNFSYSLHDSVADAYLSAKGFWREKDVIFVGGSTFVVSEVV